MESSTQVLVKKVHAGYQITTTQTTGRVVTNTITTCRLGRDRNAYKCQAFGTLKPEMVTCEECRQLLG